MRQFPPRPSRGQWPGTVLSREDASELLLAPPFRLDSKGGQQSRSRSLRQALDWLDGQPGGTWQERWAASGAEQAGRGWRNTAAAWLSAAGLLPPCDSQGRLLGAGLHLRRPDPSRPRMAAGQFRAPAAHRRDGPDP